MATVKLEEITIRVNSKLLAGIRKIAESEGKPLDAVVEYALSAYFVRYESSGVREEVIAHARASMDRNRGLLELLAEYESRCRENKS